jgi:hemolysin activation/secretion protein
MRPVRMNLSVALCLSAVCLPAVAAAQAIPPTGTTREEIERARPQPPLRSTQPGISVESDVERAPCPLDDPKYRDIKFELRDVQFGGLRSVPAELLRPAYQDLIGKTLSVANICEIRDRAATILRREGYLAAVQVPPQRIENGVVRFDALIARLVGVQVRGQAGRSDELIAAYLQNIQAQDVFNIRQAERYLLLARDIPGLDVRLVLRPAGAPGEVIGEVSVTRVPVEVDALVQNLGSRSAGRWGGLGRVQLNGLTGLGDRTILSFFSTADFEEQQVIQGGHSFKLGGEGLTFSGDFSYAWTSPSLGANIDIDARTLSAFAELSYPFIRSQTANLFGAFGLNVVNQRVDFNDVPLTRDRLRVAYARLDYDSVDPRSLAGTSGFSLNEPRWRVGGGLELRQGLDLNASDPCRANQVCLLSRAAADPTAFVARASALVEYRPQPGLTFSIAPRAQYAPDSLLSYEQFSVGNFTTGRGYDPGALSGDSGLGFQSEVRFGSLLPRTIDGFAFQPYAFADLGIVWNEAPNFTGPDPARLWSVGGGVRAAWGQRARLDVTLAAPLNRTPLQPDRDVRLLVTLSTRLLPWRR